MYLSHSTKPKKSGVYPTRTTIINHVDGEEVSQTEGYSYFSRPLDRWAVQSPTVTEALRRHETAAWRFNAEQHKEWCDDRKA